MVKIGSDKLTKAIQKHPTFGTGTLSEAAQSHPDELQRLIAREEGALEFVEKIEGLLDTTFRKMSEIEDVPVEVENPNIVDVRRGESGKSEVDLPAESNEIPPPVPTKPPPIFDEVEEHEEDKTSSPPVEICDNKSPMASMKYYVLLARTKSIPKLKKLCKTQGFDYHMMIEAEQSMKKPRESLITMLNKCIKGS